MDQSSGTTRAAALSSGMRLFRGGGEVGAILAGINWARSSLGPVETWPQALRTSLRICLSSRHAIILWWGPDQIVFYNDAYAPTLGVKHPWAAGKPGREVWSEIWSTIGPMLEGVLRTGEPTWSNDQLLFLERNGYPEETYHTFSYSPIEDDSGVVMGVFTAVTETTQRVLAERRARLASELATAMVDARSTEDVCARAARALATDPADIPFALLYGVATHTQQATLLGADNLAAGSPLSPQTVDLGAIAGAQVADPWSLATVARTRQAAEAHGIAWGAAPLEAPAGLTPRDALALPLIEPGQSAPAAILVAGVSPRRALDAEYRAFYALLADHIATALAAAHAYEEERRRAEALAEIDRAKTAFFSNVSHEFRTPLTLLLGPLEDSLAEPAGALPARQRERLEVMRRNGVRLLKLVNTLLDFARIEAGRIEAVYALTDLATYTAELASAFRSLVEKAGLALVIDCPPLTDGDGVPTPPVYVDRDMWEKIVLNLLSNAFKFTLEGSITVAMHALDAEGRPWDAATAGSAETVELQVRDTGAGIPADELPRLFERFHRIVGAQARSHEGSGIGLALVQELVHLHGGTIHAESVAGAGTTFSVRLPVGMAHLPPDRVQQSVATVTPLSVSTSLDATAYVDEAGRWLPDATPDDDASQLVLSDELWRPASGIGPARPARILLADDNADMRDYLRRLLGERYSVEAVTNGAQALAAIHRDQRPLPDLVLSDVMMPELDGFGLLRALRADPRTASLPVMLLSARAGEEATIEGLQAGADDYLVKPFSAREVLSRVEARLEMARLHSEAHASEARLRAILDLLPVGVAFVDAQGKPHIVNQKVREIWGENLPMAESRDDYGVYRAWWPATGEPVAADEWGLARALATGEASLGVEIDIETQDGVRKTILDSDAPLRDEAGRIIGGMSVIMDITERKQLERRTHEALDALLAMAATMADASGDAADALAVVRRVVTLAQRVLGGAYTSVVVLDLETNVVEPLAVTGLSPEDEERWWAGVRGSHLEDFMSSEDAAHLRAGEDTIIADVTTQPPNPGQDHWGIQTSLVTPARMERQLLILSVEVRDRSTFTAQERDLAQAAARLVALVLERARLTREREEGRLRELALEEATRRMDDFLSIASHELRTPLTSIIANVYLAEKQLHALSQSAQEERENAANGEAQTPRVQRAEVLLERTNRQVARLERLIGDLLDITRIQAGKLEMRPEACDLLAILREAVEEQRTAWPRRSISLDLPRHAPLAIIADADRIGQVVTNYLTNALKYSSEDLPVVVQAHVRGGRARVVVRDQGPGLSAEQQARLFERFYRVPGVEQQSGSGVGLGLGLYICKTIIERHGGALGLESAPGSGSAFWFTLPLAATALPRARQSAPPDEPARQ